ncbi:MAG: HAMP domain-containing sensor histidine kinase, partial [Proteobacteria bacterium]|nr:HAMP domain-containing sensor histidine kinase [Pseudomonadota bacterium]
EDIEKVVPTLKAQAQEKGLQFSMEIKNRPLVATNPMLMDQLWTNLISNAIKYTLPGGMVTIVLKEQDGWAIGSIEDTGIGLSPQELELIFHEFYRAPRAKEMERHGSGLGLSFVKRIIEGYQGTLDVTSEVGKGSRFIFKLPAVKAATQ